MRGSAHQIVPRRSVGSRTAVVHASSKPGESIPAAWPVPRKRATVPHVTRKSPLCSQPRESKEGFDGNRPQKSAPLGGVGEQSAVLRVRRAAEPPLAAP